MARKTTPSEQFKVEMGPATVTVDVFYEYRGNVRVAQGKHSVLLRIPNLTRERERKKFKDWCIDWIHKQWRTNPNFRTAYFTIDYGQLRSIRTFDRIFALHVSDVERARPGGRINDHEIEIVLPASTPVSERSKMVYDTIHVTLNKYYKPSILRRLTALHGGAFSKEVTSVSLKNMSSKWGSCSNTGRMSLSTRLLFAPTEVQDYVMIHELCHLDQLNHSKAFWDLVELHDPLYEMKEEWLNDYGHLCDVGMRPVTDP